MCQEIHAPASKKGALVVLAWCLTVAVDEMVVGQVAVGEVAVGEADIISRRLRR